MIRTVLVDDEKLAITQLEKLLKEYASMTIVAAYTDPIQAVQGIKGYNPDVIFLDINMPGLNGMQAAEMMQNACPQVDIVFVTAYDTYALEAFELNALDYVLKPVHRNHLTKTVNRLNERLLESKNTIESNKKVTILCFQTLQFESKEPSSQNFRWRTAKAQELFAYLLHNRNRHVSKDTLVDILWPDFDPKKAMTHLYTTMYHVRQYLKQNNIDIPIKNTNVSEGYFLDTSNVNIEIDEWESNIRNFTSITENNYEEYQKLVDQYSGDYCSAYDYLWAEGERQRLRTIWYHHASQLAHFLIKNEQFNKALEIYQRIIQIYPYFEEPYFELMQLFNRSREFALVEEQYHMLQKIQEHELGVDVPEHINNWYFQWKRDNKR